ncbi:4-coumarate--CoA ligase-like 9 [Citrus sinensis]|uniref:4-coumarate--CoA ligase-like 9 n=1 Tax=Citrus sinensis TaxID=2711 RepID=A0ACB8LTT6_CITSI|nr:4-coumarate--CoA ligase-like 9 [Citrus sinensis]
MLQLLQNIPFNPLNPDPGIITPSSTASPDLESLGASTSLSPDGSSFARSSSWSPEGEASSPSDDSDSLDPVLKYISQMLMEEKMEEKPCMFYDPLALQATERSLYEVLGERQPYYPPSLNQPQPSVYLNSGSGEKSNIFSNNSSDFNSDSGAVSSTSSGGNDFVESLLVGDTAEFNGSFLRNPLPEDYHSKSNSQQHKQKEDTSRVVVKVEKEERENSPEGSRGRKNHQHLVRQAACRTNTSRQRAPTDALSAAHEGKSETERASLILKITSYCSLSSESAFMAEINPNRSIDPNTGYCSETKTYYSLRPNVPLPPPSEPLSITQYALYLLRSSTTTTSATTFLVDATTGESLSYGEFLRQVHSLARSLKTRYSLSKNDVAYILSLASLHVPVLYFSLLSLGVVISPANPLSSTSEVSHQIQLSKPSIAFATSHTSYKLPSNLRTILMDSPEFISLLNQNEDVADFANSNMTVYQSDPAAILYSSGTTGKVKGVLLSHLNVIAIIAGYYHVTEETDPNEGPPPHPVSFFTLPMFHVFGFFMLVRAASKGETLVFMERFDFKKMLKAVENYRVTYMPVSPPLIVAFINSKLTDKYDLSSLQLLGCGGAPLGKEVTLKFKEKFPNVEIRQGYGLTETGGAGSRVIGPDEAERHGSVGRLAELMEAKIVDPATGEALPPGQKGELWLRGPTIMKGYVGDDKATSETVHLEGWLKTGDLCYFDSNGFLFIVDRLKELIKYKAYQVPPVELEHLLHSNPEIADAAVIPYPDEEAGQIPMAFVVRKPGSSITEAEIMDFIAKQACSLVSILK